jgi:hypothetical protein
VKVVFAVTSQGHDVYSAMTRLAVGSLRVSNPGLRVTVACDQKTDAAMQRARDPLIGEVDEWLAVQAPEGPPEFMNRHVKTRLRELIAGRFLFLDSDTFVRGELGELLALDCDVAGARNHSRESLAEQIWEQDGKVLAALDWRIGDEIYVNGGVLFYNDTEGARRFAGQWHRRWLQSASRGDYFRDQPALNAALAECAPRLAVLPDRFNAQFVLSPEVAVDAVIWHYYSSVGHAGLTACDVLTRSILDGGRLNMEEVRQLVEAPHPWTREGVADLARQFADVRNENAALRQELKLLRRDHEEVLASRSWRVTRPLRVMDSLGRQWLGSGRSAGKDGSTDK